MISQRFFFILCSWVLLVSKLAASFSPISRKLSQTPILCSSYQHNKRTDDSSMLWATPEEKETSDSSSEPSPLPSQPPVPQKRLDPLMASLTRMDPNAQTGPTKNVPLFGEVPVDGGLVVLVPAAVIAVLGFVLSIFIAFNSSDQLVMSLSNVADDIAQQASEQPNRVYDPNVCRGICSYQEKDLDGLKSFMEGLRKQ